MPRTSPSHAEALSMRAARAAENPQGNDPGRERDAPDPARSSPSCAENPSLTDKEVANAARLRLRAQMAQLAEKSVAARRRPGTA